VFEFSTLKTYGNCRVWFSKVLRYFTNLYPGLSVQFTMGRMGFPGLCSFMVPFICGALGFIFIYFHLLVGFIVFLPLFMWLHIFCCCLFVMLWGNFVKLLLSMNVFILYICAKIKPNPQYKRKDLKIIDKFYKARIKNEIKFLYIKKII
jgi:hypothetical protein